MPPPFPEEMLESTFDMYEAYRGLFVCESVEIPVSLKE